MLIPAIAAMVWLAQQPVIRTTVPLVVAPATVTEANGRLVDGLSASDFLLLDNGKPQAIQAEVHHQPISLVVAVQTSAISAAALAKIRKAGSLIEPLIIGQRGAAAIVAYADEVRVVQEFTGNPWKLVDACRGLRAGGAGGRMIDAVAEAVRMLAGRPASARRVILLIGETRDRSSEAALQETVTAAQRENVSIYPVTYSAFLTPFTAKPADAPPAGNGGMNLFAIFREIGRLGQENAAEAFVKYTGGRRLSFLKQRGLEQAISDIGEELHSQYILSFTPAAAAGDEYHPIQVTIKGRPELRVRTRPGYWLAAE